MNLTNHFLISTGNLNGSFFSESVVLVCSHDSEGAFGLVVNKPTPTSERELLSSLKVPSPKGGGDQAVMRGGPVKQEQVVVLHSPAREFDVTVKLNGDAAVTLSRDILKAVSEGAAPEKMIYFFGYSGWEGGKLESEISDNAWITVPASLDIIFDMPAESRLNEAARRLGFDISRLSDMTGNA